MDTVLNVLHVVGAVFIVGPMAILPQSALRALRAGHSGQVRTIAKSTFLFSLLSLIVVVLGFGVMGMSDPKYHVTFASTWIWLSIVLYLIALLVSLLLVVPAMHKAADDLGTPTPDAALNASAPNAAPAAAPEGAPTAARAGHRGYGAIAGGSGIATLLLVAVVVLMVWKP